MNSKEYWQKRETENRGKYLKKDKEYLAELNDIYKYTMDQVQKEIDSFYTKYATKAGITIAEAKKRASKLDMEEYSRKAKKYVAEKNFSAQANAEMRLYNMTMKVNRLELLKAQIGLELVAGFDEIQETYDKALNERTQEELMRQAGILGYTILDNAKMANAIVNASFKNATYSDRIWAHQALLKTELDKLLRTGLIQGRNPRELARGLRKVFDVSRYNSERLMITELARVQTGAQQQSYIRNGFDEYEYVACTNTDVCETCKDLGGRHFKVEDMMPGDNAPPMHPFCHCSTAAYINDKDYNDWLDGYKEHGLSFEDWKKKNILEDERKALNKYIGPDSYKLNDKLRRGLPLTNDDKEFMNNLDSALSKIPAYAGNLLRTVDIKDKKERERFLKSHEVGKEVRYNEYISTSKVEGYNDVADIMIYIQNAKNSKDISKFNSEEQEVLYERNSTFKTINVREYDGKIYIMLEEKP